MLIKIQGGTPRGEMLCKTCRYGWVRTFEDNQESIMCMKCFDDPLVVSRVVVKCSEYSDVMKEKHDSFWKTGWILDMSKSGVPLGFKPNRKYRSDNPDDEELKYR